MCSKLVDLEWSVDNALFPGVHSTESTDATVPWRCISEIIPGIFLTCEVELANRTVALEKGIALVINLCAEPHVAPFKVYEYPSGESHPRYRKVDTLDEFVSELDEYTGAPAALAVSSRKVFLHNIPALDSPNYEIDRHFPQTCALIELVMLNRSRVAETKPDTVRLPSVGVHCMVGVSRSASVVLAYLMKSTGVGRDEAISFARSTRPVVNPNPGFQQQLLLWQETNGKRIFDDFSAELVANEVRRTNGLETYVQTQLPIILRHNKCTGERQYFGYVVAKGLPEFQPDETLSAVHRELRSYITAAIDSEVYADIPNFFGYVGEVVSSVQRHAPALLFKTSSKADQEGMVWSDAFYSRVTKDVGRSGFVKDTSDTIRAFCSLLEAIHVKQLTLSPLALLHRSSTAVLEAAAAPEQLALSFPFTPFLAPYAEGFVQFSELNLLEERFPAQGSPLDAASVATISAQVFAVFSSAFLVSTTGVCSPVNPCSGDVGAAPPEGDTDSSSRWGPASRLLFLKDDVEVRVVERFLGSGSPAEEPLDDLMSACTISSEELVALALVRKLAAGAIAFRLLLETVDHFVQNAYSSRLVSDESLSVKAMSGLCERRFPVARVRSILEAVASAYTGRYGKPCDLHQYFRVELEPLVQCDVMHVDGVWSLFNVL